MGDRNHVNSIWQDLVNNPKTKPNNAAPTSWTVMKRKSFGIPLNPRQSQMHRVKELVPQSFTLAFVVFCGGYKFDICFTMIGNRLHAMARKASLITSAAGRVFAWPVWISPRRRRITAFHDFSPFASLFSSKLARIRSAISARDCRGRLKTSMQIFCAVVLIKTLFCHYISPYPWVSRTSVVEISHPKGSFPRQ